MQPRREETHAAGLLRPGEGIIRVREDVGRLNALNTPVDAFARAGHAPSTGAIVVTICLSVDLVQKCATAGAPVRVAAVVTGASGLTAASCSGCRA